MNNNGLMSLNRDAIFCKYFLRSLRRLSLRNFVSVQKKETLKMVSQLMILIKFNHCFTLIKPFCSQNMQKITKWTKMGVFQKKSENPFKCYLFSKRLLPPTPLLFWKPKKLGRAVLYQVIEKMACTANSYS